jgi:hypothetical protein
MVPLFRIVLLMQNDQTGPNFPGDNSSVSASRGKYFGVSGRIETQNLMPRMGILSFSEFALSPDIEIAIGARADDHVFDEDETIEDDS